MKKTKLTFYGGVNEIGGNKILLEDGDTRVFFDFGMSFAGESKYFSNFLKPRGVNGAGDYLEVNLLPRLKGLYSDKMLKNTDLKYTSPSIDAVILSRPHMDHVGYLWNDLNDLTKNLSAASAFESSRGRASAVSSPFKVIGLKLIP